MIYKSNNSEFLQLECINSTNCFHLKETIDDGLTLVWFEDDTTVLNIDNADYAFKANQVVCFTEFHKVAVKHIGKARLIKFNRQFYCIVDHDIEVGCKGILFFGATTLPVIDIPADEYEKFIALWKVFNNEMESKDELQLSMLQMLLKRFLILCTRLYKRQQPQADVTTIDVVREFNYLVEKHYKTKHTVAEYAGLLNKSPKTVANIFTKWGSKTPLQYIQDRKMLEAKRLLVYTDKPVKEIADELGFIDIQTFSRFFKRQQQLSPTDYKELHTKGKIAKSSGKST